MATTTPCTNGEILGTWPPARLAAQVIAVPVLDGNLDALGPLWSRAVGGALLLGTAPGDLGGRVASAQRLAGVTPLLVMADQEGGGVQRLGSLVPSLPWPRTMAATMTPAQVRQAAAGVAAAMRRVGVTVDLAPVLDIDGRDGPNARNPDGLRAFGPDGATASAYGVAFMQGLRDGGVLAVAKHFPGLGGSTANTDNGPAATQPLGALLAAGLQPFASAINAGVGSVMVANATVPDLTSRPASLSPQAIDLLTGRLGFGGLVMTDSLSAGAVTAAGYDLPGAAVAAIAAGGDMVLFGSTLTAAERNLLSPSKVEASVAAMTGALVDAVSTGRLAPTRLEQAAAKVLDAKHVSLCP